MAIALIIAGGQGSRTGNSVPKQYLTVYDTPIIVYTMRSIQQSRCFDDLYVVCAEGWRDFIDSYAEQYHISLYRGTILGGRTRFDSYANGIAELIKVYDRNTIISIIDSNRPLISSSIFQDVIRAVERADCVLPLDPCFDSMYLVKNQQKKVDDTAKREVLFKGQGPETCRIGLADDVCKKAINEGVVDMPITGLMLHYGYNVMYTEGSSKNFKITTQDDITIFRAMIREENESTC